MAFSTIKWWRPTGLLFLLAFNCGAVWSAPAVYEPKSFDEVLLSLSSYPAASAGASRDGLRDEERLDQAESLLNQYRVDGRLRWLGDAQSLLEKVAPLSRNAHFYYLDTSIKQSLHDFESALLSLEQGLAMAPGRRAFWLQKYNIHLVRGQYADARRACDKLAALKRDLYSESCDWQLRAIEGDSGAYFGMREAFASSLFSGAEGRSWAVATLADIADRQQPDDALQWWSLALKMEPGNHYVRSRYCDAALAGGARGLALELTEGFETFDSLAVCRAIALRNTPTHRSEFNALREKLDKRFAEARWRSENLHKRALARYQLDVMREPQSALQLAQWNWSEQREWPDEQILRRAEYSVVNSKGDNL